MLGWAGQGHNGLPVPMWKPILFSLAMCSWPACSIEADFATTQFRCDEVPRCPSGQMCVDGVCTSSAADGGMIDAMPPDPLLAEWQITSSLSSPRIFNHKHAAVAGGFVYVIGGFDGVELDSVIVAPIQDDGTLGGWTDTLPLPAPRALSDVVAVGDNLYVIGGASGGVATQTVYHGVTNQMGVVSWETTTPLPVPLKAHISVTNGSRVYTIGGADNSNERQAAVYFADIQNDATLGAWQSGPPLPAARANHGGALTGEGIYVIGGDDESELSQATVYLARFGAGESLDSWTTTTPLPQWRVHPTAFAAAGYLYVVGGMTSEVLHAPIQEDGMLGSWQLNTALPVPLGQHAMAVSEPYVYAISGNSNAGASAGVYYSIMPVEAMP